MNSAEEPVVLPLTDDERYLLSHGVRDWDTDGGPALATRVLAHLIWHQPPDAAAALDWSHWRRRHQARARRCHYDTRGASP